MKTHFPTVPIETAMQKATVATDPPRPLVLLVDDEPLIVETLSIILSGHGMAVITAPDGAAALEMARLMPPDILISDVAMPGMTGFDLAVEVSNASPDCDVVLFSGDPSTCDQVTTYYSKGYDFITLMKPVHPTELLSCVFELLSLRGWPVPDVTPPVRPNPADVVFFGPISLRARQKTRCRIVGRTSMLVANTASAGHGGNSRA